MYVCVYDIELCMWGDGGRGVECGGVPRTSFESAMYIESNDFTWSADLVQTGSS